MIRPAPGPASRRRACWLALVAWLVGAAACAGPTQRPAPHPNGAAGLGPRPQLGARPSYAAPAPRSLHTPQGLTVWWLPQRDLPIVSIALAIPYGSAQDPPNQPGLAFVTAEMLDEGAGNRDALAIGAAVADLGTSLSVDVSRDGSRLGCTVLPRYLDEALALLGDLVARPRFAPDAWQRTVALWKAYLDARGDDPVAAAGVVGRAALYGRNSPYGHPSRGQPDGVDRIGLDDVRRFHRAHWRPDRALLVVAGDVDRAALDQAIARAFGRWTAPQEPAPARVESPGPQQARPKLVLVDHPRAPQSVVLLTRPGVAAGEHEAPLLGLINTALGGSFTSRLNQSLREDKGWSYGVESAFFETRATGSFVVIAPVEKRVTTAAIGRALREIERMAAAGPTAEEHDKTRAQDLTRFMETYETVEGMVRRLSTLSMLGLAPDADTRASRQRQSASRAELAETARRHLDMTAATVVVVGPAVELGDQLELLGMGPPSRYGADGRPVEALPPAPAPEG